MRRWWCACACVLAWGAAGAGRHVQEALARGGTYSVRSALELSAPSPRAGRRHLAYMIHAELAVAPLQDPDHDDDVLLHFTLIRAQLMVRGAAAVADWEPRGSVWDARAGDEWHARVRRGGVRELLLDPADPRDVGDYKRALAGLFHFQAAAAAGEERNETDATGACLVMYETLGAGSARRVKRSCEGDAAAGAEARRAARYTVEGGALVAVHAEEVVTVHAAVKARSWHALARTGPAPRARPPPPAPARAPAPLAPPPPADDDDEKAPPDLDEAIRLHRAALEGEAAGEGGGAGAVRALLDLLPALRAARAPDLLRALRDPAHQDLLPGLCRALGVSGSAAAVVAAREFLQLTSEDPVSSLAHAFLAGFALAPRAPRAAVLDVLRLAGEARRPALAEAALLAAAGAARADDGARAAVREAAGRALARCRDAACRAPRLAVLASPETLLASAERDEARAALAALAALRALEGGVSASRLERVAADRSRPLEVRAAALEAAVSRRAAQPLQLARLARALHAERGPAAHELRRVLWARLEALPAAVRLLPPRLRTWEARAHGGTSVALSRDTGWRAGAWGARLDSVQVAARGVLRRGTVSLQAAAPDGRLTTELEVSVWTRGLEALAGGGEGDEGEGAAGGLAVSVGGTLIKEITLFDGQAELLGHIWSGTGAAPAPVVRALRPLHESAATLPLLAGVTLRVRARAGVALALDASAAASLWHRTARGSLALRAALAGDVTAAVRTEWGTMRAERRLHLEPRLAVDLDLDFYDEVALCVRAATPDHELREEAVLESSLGARRLRVRRERSERRAGPGRTLALGRRNDAACRALRAADAEDD